MSSSRTREFPMSSPITPPKLRRIVCFGDSITGPHPSQAKSYQSGFLKYSDILECLLNAPLPVPEWEVLNRGWVGAKASGGPDHPGAVARASTEILPLEPDVVTVLIGGNDMVENSPEAHRACECALMALGEALRSVQRVIVMLYPHAMPAPEHEGAAWRHLELANPLLSEMAERLGFQTLDLRPVFQQVSEIHAGDQLLDPIDGVHLRPMGELAIAAALFHSIKLSE